VNPSPILRWAGSKRKVVSRLRSYWRADCTRYIEPFAGSCALFFALNPKRAILADLNSDLIATYRTIVAQPRAVYECATAAGPSRARFIELRQQEPRTLDPVRRAARFLYLNRYCFNGLYRTNASGQFNVPYAPLRSGRFPPWEVFMSASTLLAQAEFVAGDFEDVVMRRVRPGDFVYLDPPYAVGNRRVFKQYDSVTFGLSDLERLAAALHSINAVGARFLVSYAHCSEALSVFRYWDVRRSFVHRNISGFAKHRRRSAELLISN
jgi:DNA adenine methylase